MALEADQTVPLTDWLRAYTNGAAWAGGQEDERGSLTPGKRADFVVLDGPLDGSGPVSVAETWVDGSVATADIADPAQLSAAISALESELGPVDMLVANAGIGAYGPFADIEPELMERLVAVNVLGTMYAVRAVVPGMISRRRGHIVTIGSIAGRIGAPFEAVYSATKFAQVGFTEALSVELSPYGVGVSMVNPGPVATDFFDARGHAYDRARPRQIPPERVAGAVIRAVETGKLERLVPGWFRPAVVIRHLVPPLHQWGSRRTFRTELEADGTSRP